MAKKRNKGSRSSKPLGMRHIVSYRGRGGRFISKEASRETVHKKVVIDMQTRGSKFVRGYQVLSGKSTTKTAQIANTGMNAGLIWEALARTNITTRLKDARRFEVTIKGRDRSEKARRIKWTLDITKKTTSTKAGQYMIFAVIQALRRRGFRTQYNLDRVAFTDRRWTKNKAKKMKVLHDVEIQVRVIK